MKLIQTVSIGTESTSTIEFTSIPQTYTDLLVLFAFRVVRPGVETDIMKLTFNGSGAGKTSRRVEGNGSTVYSGSDAQTYIFQANGSGATANTFGIGEIYIPNYTGSQNKIISNAGISETNASTAYMGMSAAQWADSAAITSISMTPDQNGNFVQYSTMSLYGILKGTGGADAA